jgi:enoyl-CoA hydratase
MTNAVLYETRGAIAIITINRPERRNSLGTEVRQGIRDGFERFEADPALQVAILTGTGDQAFCAGMDLKEAAVTGLKIPPRGPGGVPVIGDDLKVTKCTIAAVNGVAMAGGWLMAQMCDLCVVSETAKFAITEVKVGRGTPWAVPLLHMLPQRVIMEILLTGDFVSAQRLFELGYVNKVVPQAALLDESIALAERIVAGAPLTARACREMIHMAGEMGRSAAMKVADRIFAPVYLSEDAQEGPRAFAEKRPPVWKGR